MDMPKMSIPKSCLCLLLMPLCYQVIPLTRYRWLLSGKGPSPPTQSHVLWIALAKVGTYIHIKDDGYLQGFNLLKIFIKSIAFPSTIYGMLTLANSI